MKKFCTAVVLAAGRGSRMGTALAKQYLTLGDKPVVVYSLEAFQASPVIDEIILITDKDHIEYCWEKLVHPYGITKVTAVAPGGKERYESVWKALCLLCGKNSRNEAGASAGDGYVFIHDGARPFITEDIICLLYTSDAADDGESGIRTHAPFRTNGFQDRLVMTTSISLQTCFSILQG